MTEQSSDLLVVSDLVVKYSVRHGWRSEAVRAVDHVSFSIPAGASIGLVGESGSGKSTIARSIVGLAPLTNGEILFRGERIGGRYGHTDVQRRSIQMVFQDPYSSLNPWMTVEEIVGEGLMVHGIESDSRARRIRVIELLKLVSLDESALGRRAHAFSGGQRQRIAIARSLAVEPSLLICDEAVSSLDVSVQAQIVNLLADLRSQLGLALLFIGHDLPVVRTITEHVIVLKDGVVVERGPSDTLFQSPSSSYTQGLVAAVPAGFEHPPE